MVSLIGDWAPSLDLTRIALFDGLCDQRAERALGLARGDGPKQTIALIRRTEQTLRVLTTSAILLNSFEIITLGVDIGALLQSFWGGQNAA
jgi:hypothetical protein